MIAVIGILATITVVGFGRYQADGRDTQRASDASIIVEHLEKYYRANGEYKLYYYESLNFNFNFYTRKGEDGPSRACK